MNITLKELLNVSKKYDIENNVTTDIRVFVTSNNYENKKRHTIVFNPESKAFYDTISIIAYEDCTVSDIDRHIINDKENMMIVIIDLDDQ